MLFIIIKPRFYLENNTQKKEYIPEYLLFISVSTKFMFQSIQFYHDFGREKVNNGYNPYFPMQFISSKIKSINPRIQDKKFSIIKNS